MNSSDSMRNEARGILAGGIPSPHRFCNTTGGLIMDRYGNLYCTTDVGGSIADPCSGFGTVFTRTPLDAAKTKWQETVLYRFTGVADGQNPMNALTLDAAGALYGTTIYGGTGSCTDFLSNILGCGTV